MPRRNADSKQNSITGKGAPTDLDFEKALMFFHAYMYGPLQGKLRLYEARGVRSVGKAQPSDWEVFASILVKDLGTKLGKGVDLSGHEVKSAEKGGAYEYQYHKKSGKGKLLEDMQKGHLFFDHSDNLRTVDLRYASGKQLSKFFDVWLEELPDPYTGQRFRKSVPFKWVRDNATLLMSLRNGEVEFPRLRTASREAFASPLEKTKPS
ncbi:MAG: hypothetical protein WBX38_11145 [Candidatus Sulfotelmatobacter sp.]